MLASNEACQIVDFLFAYVVESLTSSNPQVLPAGQLATRPSSVALSQRGCQTYGSSLCGCATALPARNAQLATYVCGGLCYDFGTARVS